MLFSLPPGLARAGGYEVGDTGAEAMGRGGSFVAKADNPTAINYNPAGLAKLRGYQGALSLDLVHTAYDFQRTGAPEGESAFVAIGKTNPWFAAPLHFMVTADFGISRRLTFAAGYYAPPTVANQYPREIRVDGQPVALPHRYDLISQEGILAFPTLAVAYRATDWLDVGLSLQSVVIQMRTLTTAVATIGCQDFDSVDCDVQTDIEGRDFFAPTGSAGVLLRPVDFLELGASIRLPARSEMHGKARFTFGAGLQEASRTLERPLLTPSVPSATIVKKLPWMFRLGGRLVRREGGRERADLEVDLAYELWSRASTNVITLDGTVLGSRLAPLTLDLRLKDTLSLRLGGSLCYPLPGGWEWVFRAGGFAETESTATRDTRLHVPGPRRLGLTAGIGLAGERWKVDFAYVHLFFPAVDVQGSGVRALDLAAAEGPLIGDGHYEYHYDAMLLQLSVALGGFQ